MTVAFAYMMGLVSGLLLASFFWFVSSKVLCRSLEEEKGEEG